LAAPGRFFQALDGGLILVEFEQPVPEPRGDVGALGKALQHPSTRPPRRPHRPGDPWLGERIPDHVVLGSRSSARVSGGAHRARRPAELASRGEPDRAVVGALLQRLLQRLGGVGELPLREELGALLRGLVGGRDSRRLSGVRALRLGLFASPIDS